jgi:hypothetical protein
MDKHPHDHLKDSDTETLVKELASRKAKKNGNGWKKWLSVSGITAIMSVAIAWPYIKPFVMGPVNLVLSGTIVADKQDEAQKQINGLKDNQQTLWQWKESVNSDLKHIEDTQREERITLHRIEDKLDARDKALYSPKDKP